MSPEHDFVSVRLGAAALDALEAQEMQGVLAHVEQCAACRQDLDELREAAALLGSIPALPPEHLWDRISQQLQSAPPPLRLQKVDRASRWRSAFLGVAASITLLAVGAFGFQYLDPAPEPSIAELAQSARTQPNAMVLPLRSASGDPVAEAIIGANGSYFLNEGLPELPAGQTYQLWALTGNSLVSAGVLGSSPENVAFSIDGTIKALAVTEEIEGGVVQSSNTPVASVAMPADLAEHDQPETET